MARHIHMEKLQVNIGMAGPAFSPSGLIVNFLVRVCITQCPLNIVFPPQKLEVWQLYSRVVCVCVCFLLEFEPGLLARQVSALAPRERSRLPG